MDKHRNSALRARQKVCEGRPEEALLSFEQSKDSRWFIQQIAVLLALGRREDVASLVTQHICPSDAEWCEWCVRQMYAADGEVDGSGAPEEVIWHYSNDPEGRYRETDIVTLDP